MFLKRFYRSAIAFKCDGVPSPCSNGLGLDTGPLGAKAFPPTLSGKGSAGKPWKGFHGADDRNGIACPMPCVWECPNSVRPSVGRDGQGEKIRVEISLISSIIDGVQP